MADTQSAIRCQYCGYVSVGGKYHEQQCDAPPVAVPALTEPSGATELPELPSHERFTNGEVCLAWRLRERERQLRDYKAKYEDALQQIAELRGTQ